ncbi:MAG: peptidylprolyl isomerase [Bdellovibrionota bacterium]
MKTVSVLALAAIAISANVWAATELAKVNGRTITDKDLHNALASLNEGQRQQILGDSNSRRQVLISVIDQEILFQNAEKEKLDQDAEFKDAIDQFKKQFLANRLLSKDLSSKLTDSAAKKYFETHKTRYSTDEVHAQHILVTDEKRAQELIKEAKGGADFQDLAEKNSRDPSAKNNRGDLGFFGRDRMVPEFTDAAFAGQDGEIVGPVKTAYGYHVIKVLEHKIGKNMNFDEVELRVRNDLKAQLVQEYVEKLKKGAKITVNDKAVEAMK